jgi:D-alanine-D-alanine ligase
MRIGITYDLKQDVACGADLPDDFQEEFDSPATIEAIAGVLRSLGHRVEMLGDGRPLLERLLTDPPDLVFNIAEGQGVGRSREARVPAVLEMLGIAYTGSDPLTLAVTLDKDCAKRLVASAGVSVPRGVVIHPQDDPETAFRNPRFSPGYPCLLKPAWEGSSKGIRARCLVQDASELTEVVADLRRDYRQPLLAEEYIEGDELTVGVIGNDNPTVLGVMRVQPRHKCEPFIYSLAVKRDWQNQVHYECPARLAPSQLRAVKETALQAYRLLGCRDVSRVDFRLRDGVPYFLEVNPLPGLNPESSDLVIMARLSGCSYEELITRILHAAQGRYDRIGSASSPSRSLRASGWV